MATSSGQRAPFVDALFTAASAVCVTGLTVVDTATYWSGFGQVVIMVAIKIGGLGIITLASLLGLAVARRLGLRQRLIAASETKALRLADVRGLLRAVIIMSTTLELAIAVVLLPSFLAEGEGVGTALYHSLFYGISSFNNAGFSRARGRRRALGGRPVRARTDRASACSWAAWASRSCSPSRTTCGAWTASGAVGAAGTCTPG